MKFVQINAWYGALRYNLFDFLKKEDADIVNLQEVDAGLKNAFHFSLYSRLCKQLGYRYSFYTPKLSARLGGSTVSFGQLILSKYSIEHKKGVPINGKPKTSNLMDEDKSLNETNILQHAKIRANGKTINVLNYHGYWIYGTKKGNEKTLGHSKRIIKYMEKIPDKEMTILSGDFNLAPNCKSMQVIGERYQNLILKYKIKTTRNILSFPKEPVDNIFVNEKVRIKYLKVPNLLVSDHLPMIMEFDFATNKK